MCLVAWYLLFEICRFFLCLRYNQNLIFSCGFHSIKNKEFYFFVFAVLLPRGVGYVVLFFVVVLSFYKKCICGWLGSSCLLRYFNIQKTFHFVVIVCYVLFWERFWLSGCVDCLLWLFSWLILWLIDEIVFRVCLLCFVLSVLLIERFWIVCCNFVLVFCWTVVILCERRKIMDWRCIATLLLLNLT